MEGSPENSYRFRDAWREALLAGAVIAILTEGFAVEHALDEGKQAHQAERVVELLQQANGPESVIADQQAEAKQHHDNAVDRWEGAARLLVGYPVATGAAGGLLIWERRRRLARRHTES